MTSSLHLAAILGIGVLAMSSASIFIRFAQADGVVSIVIAAYRLTIATLVLTLPALKQRAWEDYAKLSNRDIGLLLLSGLLLGLHFATWITSLAHTSVVSSIVLVTTTPLWIGLASPLLLGERTPRLTWLGILLAIIGGTIIAFSDGGRAGGSSLWGNFLALLGAITGAGYLMIGRSVREKLRFIPYVWVVYGVAAMLLLGWSLIGGYPLAAFAPRTYIWLAALGLIPQLIGHSAANYAVRHLSATFVSVTTLGEPIGSTVLAIIFLAEWPLPLQLIGGTFILGGIGLASIPEDSQ